MSLKSRSHTNVPSESRVDKVIICTSVANFRIRSLSYIPNRNHENILLNIQDSFTNEFKSNEMLTKLSFEQSSSGKGDGLHECRS